MSRHDMSQGFKDAEASFLASLRGQPTVEPPLSSSKEPVTRGKGRPRGNSRIVRIQKALLQPSSIHFFQEMLDDRTEKQLWMSFITAKTLDLDPVTGQPKIGEDGFPILKDIELNPISWQAFKLAVAYKRGMPTIKVEDSSKSPKGMELVVTYQGAGQDFFEAQAKTAGLLK